MYNYRLKEYQNGTLQLTFYGNPIYLKNDRADKSINTQGSTFWDEPTRNSNDVDSLYSDNPFVNFNDMYNVSIIKEKEGAELDEIICLTDEEILERKDKALRSSLNRSKRMIYDYGRSNIWDWFFTFTFDPVDVFDRFNYEECKSKVTEWLHNVRKRYCKDMKYLVVPEQHESGAWHFHALVSNVGFENDNTGLTFVNAINNQPYLKINGEYIYDKNGQHVPNKYFGKKLRTSYPDGNYIYNIKEFKSGFSTATRITDTKKAVSYIVKYITKELCDVTFGKRRYLPSNNLQLPETTTAMYAPDALNILLQDIEYNYKVKLSIDAVKTYIVDVPNYKNTITVFEFNPN